jgi:polysaccharide biosynthesis/export protein VpsN
MDMIRSLRTAALLLALLPAALPAQNADAGGAARVAAEPTIRPGDRVLLRIWNEPAMSDTFTVARTGEVTLPRLGAIQVEGRRILALQDSLRTAYSVYLRNPSVEVTVLRRVSVLGEVKQPGLYLADLTMSLPEVIARAGGPTEAGNPDHVTVLRGTERLTFGRGDRERLLVAQLESGDQVVVGRRSFLARNSWAVVTTAMTLGGYILAIVLPAQRN